MSIAKPLYLLMCSTIVGLIAVGAVGLLLMDRVYQAANFANDKTVPSLEVLNTAMKAFSRQRLGLFPFS